MTEIRGTVALTGPAPQPVDHTGDSRELQWTRSSTQRALGNELLYSKESGVGFPGMGAGGRVRYENIKWGIGL